MQNTQIVFLSSDTDCDGTSYSATRLSVPAHLTTEAERLRYAASYPASDLGLVGIREEEVYAVMTLRDFLREYGHVFRDSDHRDHFCGAWDPMQGRWIDGHGYEGGVGLNYVGIGARWNPWVYDDTIGIPALDTRYEESYF